MAAMVPIRIVWGNWINGLATIRAVAAYLSARLRGHELSWSKTTHEYPSRTALLGQARRLGDILIQNQLVDQNTIEQALRNKGELQRLGEYLVRINAITEEQLAQALTELQG